MCGGGLVMGGGRRVQCAGALMISVCGSSWSQVSDLDVVLRSLDVTHLVLTGIATSGVVLSTLRQAADLDYGLTVLADGCAGADPEVHRVLLEKVFPRQAAVRTTDDWITDLQRA